MATNSLWQRYQQYFLRYDDLGFSLDISRMRFPDGFLEQMQPRVEQAFAAMRDLEAGGLANPDEKRQVGHYWLRSPELAPNDELRANIIETNARIYRFASDIHVGRIPAPGGKPFEHVLLIGIGGSALGPQFVADALGTSRDLMNVFFFDNTDPDGFDRVFEKIGSGLAHTLVVVVSKSGGTKETRNGMLEAQERFTKAGLDFPKHAVAVTGAGSELDKYAESNGWLARFPMFDWIGGRTSVMSAVGLVPAALQGLDTEKFLAGAAAMDAHTRQPTRNENAAMLLALMWFYAGDGQGKKDMVILPYKDRLALFSKYLQQLVMESLGKEKDLDGRTVHQGIAVYGNKGSTDQHAYVQQLRDGVPNFFVTFIEVRKDRSCRAFRGRTGSDERRLSARLSPRNARGALRKRARLDHAQHSAGRCLSSRRAHCALRTGGRVLRLPRAHQCVSSTRGRGREKSRNADLAIAAQSAGATLENRGEGRGDRAGDWGGAGGRLPRPAPSRGEQFIHPNGRCRAGQ